MNITKLVSTVIVAGASVASAGCLSAEEELAECLVEKEVYVVGIDHEEIDSRCKTKTQQQKKYLDDGWDVLVNNGHFINCFNSSVWEYCWNDLKIEKFTTWIKYDSDNEGNPTNELFRAEGVYTPKELSEMFYCPYDP